jgi:hypothetical protein
VIRKGELTMKEIAFTKQKSLAQLQYLLKHYQQIYPQAKLQGKIVLRQYFKKVNYQIHHLQFRSQGK